MRREFPLRVCHSVAALCLRTQGSGADPATEARIYFQRGVELVGQGELAEAAERFLESDRLAPNPNALFNAASCFERLDLVDGAFGLLAEYRVRVAGDAELERAADEALARLGTRVAQLVVESEPPGAVIWVDRRALGDFGRTPRTLALAEGPHLLWLELTDHATAELQVQARRGERHEVRETLRRLTGRLAVRSEPAGATVSIEGREPSDAGPTPVEVELPAGEYRVTVTADGRRAEARTVKVPAEATAELTVGLVPLPPPSGRLVVAGNVAGAVVLLDGVERGFTPVVLDDVLAGFREVTVRARDGRVWSGSADVPVGGSTWVSPEFP
jgi:hypothetical protein